MKAIAFVLVVAAAAVAAPLAAADREPAPAELETEEVYVFDIDRNGKQIGPKIKLSKEEREAHRVRSADPQRSLLARRAPARAAYSGCRAINVARIHYTLFWNVAYKFWQRKDYCWSYPRVTGTISSHWLSDVDPNFVWRGLISSWGDFFHWCCGVWNSGHQSFRQGVFENCIFGYGCIGTTYPWVKIYAYGNGNYGYDTGS